MSHARITLTIYDLDVKRFPSENDIRRFLIDAVLSHCDKLNIIDTEFGVNGIEFINKYGDQVPYPVFSESEPVMVS